MSSPRFGLLPFFFLAMVKIPLGGNLALMVLSLWLLLIRLFLRLGSPYLEIGTSFGSGLALNDTELSCGFFLMIAFSLILVAPMCLVADQIATIALVCLKFLCSFLGSAP